ncbi:MAG: DEAD/DEAH box helicase [Bacilli bacterium]|nr:DEAD/DEAH box helicase [Bacilli bacterium]
MKFEDLKIIKEILSSLEDKNYQEPTEIQKLAIPAILSKKDLLGCAQTGTGKTAAFAIPIIQMLQEYKNKLLKMYELLMKLPNIEDIKYYKQLVENYKLCEKISFDYAIMEKSNEAYVIPSEFGWDDIGTWSSIERYISEDQDSNIIKGNVTMQNSKNCIVYGNDKKIILSDIEDIYFIESDDVIIVGKKDKINDVHEYVKIK